MFYCVKCEKIELEGPPTVEMPKEKECTRNGCVGRMIRLTEYVDSSHTMTLMNREEDVLAHYSQRV